VRKVESPRRSSRSVASCDAATGGCSPQFCPQSSGASLAARKRGTSTLSQTFQSPPGIGVQETNPQYTRDNKRSRIACLCFLALGCSVRVFPGNGNHLTFFSFFSFRTRTTERHRSCTRSIRLAGAHGASVSVHEGTELYGDCTFYSLVSRPYHR
jgi:hypothetical protein